MDCSLQDLSYAQDRVSNFARFAPLLKIDARALNVGAFFDVYKTR